MNLYSCTNLDASTRGTQNRILDHKQRSPQYYEYAATSEDAVAQIASRFPQLHDFDAVLIKESVEMPTFDTDIPLALTAGGAA